MPCTSPQLPIAPPWSCPLLSCVQLWWGPFSGVSQMFVLLLQPPRSCLPLPSLYCGCWVMKIFLRAWASLSGSRSSPAPADRAKSRLGSGSVAGICRCQGAALKSCLNLSSFVLAQQCHVSNGFRDSQCHMWVHIWGAVHVGDLKEREILSITSSG